MTTEEPSDKSYLEKLIEQSIQSKGSHYDIAMIIYFIYKNDYKVNNDKWYKKNEKSEWIEMEAANDLYINISRKIFDILTSKHHSLFELSRKAKTLDESDTLKEKARILKKIADSCKMVNYKNNLIKECKPLFIVDD